MKVERQLTLDGIRGIAASAVLISHYLAEVPGGLGFFAWGAIAVDVFFVLSGFLIGRLILTRRTAPNFFATFYIRRLLRTVPSYLLVVFVVLGLAALLPDWAGSSNGVPLWSYVAFVQNMFFSLAGSTGLEWLEPTWTLAVEEQFYLVAPAALVVLPRRRIIQVAALAFIASLSYRAAMVAAGTPLIEFLPHLLARTDTLAAGVVASVLWFRIEGSKRFDKTLEVIPLAALLILFACAAFWPNDSWMVTIFHSVLAIAAAAYILRAAVSPESVSWLEARWMRFMGDNSYSIYLIHMPVAGIIHHLVAGAPPGIATPGQWLATVLATAVTLMVGRLLTRLVEQPLTELGRSFRWESPPAATRRTAA